MSLGWNDVYIPYRKYQVEPFPSPWFSAARAAAIAHRNRFFRLYQKDKTSDSKVKFKQANNHCKRVLEAAKLAYANKTKGHVHQNRQVLGLFVTFDTSVTKLSKINNLVCYQK